MTSNTSPRRPRLRRALTAGVALSLIGGGVAAATAGVPEIDKANSTMRLVATPKFTSKTCSGEDGQKYVTYRGGWKGVETDVTPGSTDYNLSGRLTVGKIVWTVNLETRRGVLSGVALLTDAKKAQRTYLGPLRLVTQGLPSAAGGVAAARGWLDAATYTKGVADGGSVLANVEMQINASFAAQGRFGDSAGTFSTPSYAVATANQDCP
jgi:hypothetical protein